MNASFIVLTTAWVIYLHDGAGMYVCPSKIQSEGRDLLLLALLLPHPAVRQGTVVAQLKDEARENGTKSQRNQRRTAPTTRGRGHTSSFSLLSQKAKSKCGKTDLQVLPGKWAAAPTGGRLTPGSQGLREEQGGLRKGTNLVQCLRGRERKQRRSKWQNTAK